MDDAKFNLSAEPDECNECGAHNGAICEAEIDELMKSLDTSDRLLGRLARAGQNLDTKVAIQRHKIVVERARYTVRRIYRTHHYEFEDLRERAKS